MTLILFHPVYKQKDNIMLSNNRFQLSTLIHFFQGLSSIGPKKNFVNQVPPASDEALAERSSDVHKFMIQEAIKRDQDKEEDELKKEKADGVFVRFMRERMQVKAESPMLREEGGEEEEDFDDVSAVMTHGGKKVGEFVLDIPGKLRVSCFPFRLAFATGR